jgi:hypothetical protein
VLQGDWSAYRRLESTRHTLFAWAGAFS